VVLSPWGRERTAPPGNPYGTGGASRRILAIVRGAAGGDRTKRFVDLAHEALRAGAGRDREEER
jgi:UDP-N-acetylglucosamine 2-epimerase (non-hydrolysing)